jgi:hypothetical protein
MPVNRPKKPVRNGGRRRSSASIPTNIVQQSTQSAQGTGSRFMEAATREPDFGSGLPKAVRPVVAATPAEIRSRAAQKQEANRRRTARNNVRGYVAPGLEVARPEYHPLPTAVELLAMEGVETPATPTMPTAEELLHLTDEQEYGVSAHDEGTYHFPQVAPTKTIAPQRPRTLEAGWERVPNPDHPAYPGILRVRFRDGTPWEYYQVPSGVWQRFKRVQSPGRFINRVLNNYPYGRGDF